VRVHAPPTTWQLTFLSCSFTYSYFSTAKSRYVSTTGNKKKACRIEDDEGDCPSCKRGDHCPVVVVEEESPYCIPASGAETSSWKIETVHLY
jgi:hypothetical protein